MKERKQAEPTHMRIEGLKNTTAGANLRQLLLQCCRILVTQETQRLAVKEVAHMCPSCGEELCKHCKGCHNKECERYTEPTEVCIPDVPTQQSLQHVPVEQERG